MITVPYVVVRGKRGCSGKGILKGRSYPVIRDHLRLENQPFPLLRSRQLISYWTQFGHFFVPYNGTSPELTKCQFQISSEPLWAWDCLMLDRKDSNKELLNCVLGQIDAPLERKRRPDCGPPYSSRTLAAQVAFLRCRHAASTARLVLGWGCY